MFEDSLASQESSPRNKRLIVLSRGAGAVYFSVRPINENTQCQTTGANAKGEESRNKPIRVAFFQCGAVRLSRSDDCLHFSQGIDFGDGFLREARWIH